VLLKQLHGVTHLLVEIIAHYHFLKKQWEPHTSLMTHHPHHLFLHQIKGQEEMLSNQEFANKVNTEGGASRNFQTFEEAKAPGIMVSKPGAERVTDAPLKPEEASRFRKDYDVQTTGSDYHGAWKSGGKVFQDVSTKHTNLESARKAGSAGKQIAGYDLGGTDVRRPEGGEVFFDRGVRGVESDPEWKSTPEATSIPERMSPKHRAQEFAEKAHVSRGATNKGKKISINEVYATIAKNRRNRGI
jgi:hypothetical protein